MSRAKPCGTPIIFLSSPRDVMQNARNKLCMKEI